MTDIEICQMALVHVKTEGIASFDDDTAQGRACKALYGPTRDAVLEDRLWSFAKTQLVLDAPNAVAPLFFYSKRWGVPDTIIKVHRVSADPYDPTGELTDWDLQGRFILTGDADKLYVTAVQRVENAALFSPGFAMALSLRLAYLLAMPMAENRQLKADLWSEYQKVLHDAGGSDGSQGKMERTRNNRYRNVR